MNDLISRKALMEVIRLERNQAILGKTAAAKLIKYVNTAPAVEAAPVVHGRWEQIGYDKAMDRISCSYCKEYWSITDNDTETFNYCPNCGAKMDGKSNVPRADAEIDFDYEAEDDYE